MSTRDSIDESQSWKKMVECSTNERAHIKIFYCDGYVCRECSKDLTKMFTMLDHVINSTDMDLHSAVCICTSHGCLREHDALYIDMSNYVTNTDDVDFLANIIGLSTTLRRMNVDIRKIIISLDFLGANSTLTLIRDAMTRYDTISLACAASIHECNQKRPESLKIEQNIALEITKVDNMLPWYMTKLFDTADYAHLCQCYSPTILLTSVVYRWHAREAAFRAVFTEGLINIASKFGGHIAGMYAAAMASDVLFTPEPGTGSVDVFFFGDIDEILNDVIQDMVSWCNKSEYVQDTRTSKNTITYRHEYFVAVVLRFISPFRFCNKIYLRNVVDSVLWQYDVDSLRAYIHSVGHVSYIPIAIKDWADKTQTKSGFMIEIPLYPNNREHCRKGDSYYCKKLDFLKK
jgi:hypothetical protein